MGYKNAAQILPAKLLADIQTYVDGEWIYIPRMSEKKKNWGADTSTRRELKERNDHIYADFLAGAPLEALAEKYFLSVKSIQRILGQRKTEKERLPL